MADTTNGNGAHAEAAEIESRETILKRKFAGNYEALQGVFTDLSKAEYEAYKNKVLTQKPVFKKRAEIFKKIDKFWLESLNNHGILNRMIDPVDRDALAHLEDFWIEHDDKDPREYELQLTFSAKNPYFKERVLKKKFTLKPAPGSEAAKEHPDAPVPGPYDLDGALQVPPPFLAFPKYPAPVEITWTSDEHNLIKKAPAPNLENLEEYDELPGFGSIFNWIASGKDDNEIGEALLEWWPIAAEFYAGLVPEESAFYQDFDDDEDDEDDDEDPAKEIDLEDEDRPKKKQRKD